MSLRWLCISELREGIYFNCFVLSADLMVDKRNGRKYIHFDSNFCQERNGCVDPLNASSSLRISMNYLVNCSTNAISSAAVKCGCRKRPRIHIPCDLLLKYRLAAGKGARRYITLSSVGGEESNCWLRRVDESVGV